MTSSEDPRYFSSWSVVICTCAKRKLLRYFNTLWSFVFAIATVISLPQGKIIILYYVYQLCLHIFLSQWYNFFPPYVSLRSWLCKNIKYHKKKISLNILLADLRLWQKTFVKIIQFGALKIADVNESWCVSLGFRM